MVHEIRNPLNSINLFAQILLSAEELGEENQSYVYKITQEVERIDGILIQMLASSPVDKGKLKKVNLTEVIDKVLLDYRARIEKQQVVLQLKVDSQVPSIRADPLDIEKVFTNLISNALFEMTAGGVLTISLQADAEKISITVADTGSGIPAANISRIFDPFFTTKEKGTGFGLSVVLQVVKSCCGKIHVDSPPGSGACFSIELPLLPDSVH